MPLLKTNTKKKKERVPLGVNIDPEVSSFLVLHCKANGISKTQIANTIITKWVEENNTEKTTRVLVNKTARRIIAVWKDSLSKHKKGRKRYKDFGDFCDVMREELVSKGIVGDAVDSIINKVIKLNSNYVN